MKTKIYSLTSENIRMVSITYKSRSVNGMMNFLVSLFFGLGALAIISIWSLVMCWGITRVSNTYKLSQMGRYRKPGRFKKCLKESTIVIAVVSVLSHFGFMLSLNMGNGIYDTIKASNTELGIVVNTAVTLMLMLFSFSIAKLSWDLYMAEYNRAEELRDVYFEWCDNKAEVKRVNKEIARDKKKQLARRKKANIAMQRRNASALTTAPMMRTAK